MHGVPRRANVALPVHLAHPSLEQRCAATEHHRGEVQAQLVDEARLERLAADVAPAQEHDVTMCCGRARLVDRGARSLTKVKRSPGSRSNRTSCRGEWVTTKNGGVPV